MPSPEKIEFKAKEEELKKSPEEVREDFREYERFGAKVREILNPEEERKEFSCEHPFKEVKDIKYITKEGKTLSIEELLPPDWKLARGSILWNVVSPSSKEIRYDSSSIPIKGFFLGLLHEIGHAHFNETLKKRSFGVFQYWQIN